MVVDPRLLQQGDGFIIAFGALDTRSSQPGGVVVRWTWAVRRLGPWRRLEFTREVGTKIVYSEPL